MTNFCNDGFGKKKRMWKWISFKILDEGRITLWDPVCIWEVTYHPSLFIPLHFFSSNRSIHWVGDDKVHHQRVPSMFLFVYFVTFTLIDTLESRKPPQMLLLQTHLTKFGKKFIFHNFFFVLNDLSISNNVLELP